METSPPASHWAQAGTGRWHYCYHTGTAYCGAKLTGERTPAKPGTVPGPAGRCQVCYPRYENELIRAAQAANKAVKTARAAELAKQQYKLF